MPFSYRHFYFISGPVVNRFNELVATGEAEIRAPDEMQPGLKWVQEEMINLPNVLGLTGMAVAVFRLGLHAYGNSIRGSPNAQMVFLAVPWLPMFERFNLNVQVFHDAHFQIVEKMANENYMGAVEVSELRANELWNAINQVEPNGAIH